jgi:predicted Rossmann-fold nucleotide-binding protein
MRGNAELYSLLTCRIKECIVFEGGRGTVDEIVKAMDMDSLPRGQELLRALIPACEFLQISIKLGAQLLAQTAALFWSVEHMFYNIDVGD